MRQFPQSLAGLVAGLVLVPVLAVAESMDEWTPDIEAWNSPPPPAPGAVLVRNATLWTGTDDGIVEGADLLVRDGRIDRIGTDLSAPGGDVHEIDGTGMHVTPGIIDGHSHAAMLGGVNEMTRISTADVRVRDVINSESVHIYRQLAGGVTTVNLLHGSANAIGGQNAIIKFRWGQPPAELLVEDAPAGIKFALGENPKQSNWDVDEPRYPQTRHGVEQIIREKFQQAGEYQRALDDMPTGQAGRDRVAPRPDHELEAIAEILRGERDVHAHAYRADEMLALMRLAEQFDFTIKTFQHVLEGYKIAPQMAEHGAGGSTFIDWWGFKHEAIDGIGYNPALMHEAGVVTALHSDNPELGRRMNLEAAKAVRYGEVDEHDALKMITAWAADQLGIGDRIGRLAEGFDADFVVWNGHPLSVYSRVEETWVDGRRYFHRAADERMRENLEAERAGLMARVLDDNGETTDNGEANGDGDSDADAVDEPPDPAVGFAAHLLGYSHSELDHDRYCILHEH